MKRIFLVAMMITIGLSFGKAQTGQSIKKVAILEVVDRDNSVNYGVKLLLRTTLAKAITQTRGYEGYDRVDMGAIQGEQDFQRTGMVSDEQIKRLGEMTGAAYVLVAETAKIDATNMIVTAKILDVETAKLERTDYEQMGMSAQEMAEGCRTMAGRLFASPELVIGRGGKTEGTMENELFLDPESTFLRKGGHLFLEDKYMVLEKMSEVQERNYLENYYVNWKQQRKRWNGSVVMMSLGGAFGVAGIGCFASCVGDYIDYQKDHHDYTSKDNGDFMAMMGGVWLGVGIVLEAVGASMYVKTTKNMDRIVKGINEQRGIAPYRTSVSLNVGSQPHGFGLGLYF